eukprot:2037464-Rhodomonas_salina.1
MQTGLTGLRDMCRINQGTEDVCSYKDREYIQSQLTGLAHYDTIVLEYVTLDATEEQTRNSRNSTVPTSVM